MEMMGDLVPEVPQSLRKREDAGQEDGGKQAEAGAGLLARVGEQGGSGKAGSVGCRSCSRKAQRSAIASVARTPSG